MAVAGAGIACHRVYPWARIPIANATGHAWVLRRVDSTGEIAYYRTFLPRPVPLRTLAMLAHPFLTVITAAERAARPAPTG